MELVSLVRLEGVTKQVTLPDESTLDILRGVDLAVSAGDHVAIVGRSGSGKSTLLNILGLLDLPTSGTAEFRGTPVAGIRRGRLDRDLGQDLGKDLGEDLGQDMDRDLGRDLDRPRLKKKH